MRSAILATLLLVLGASVARTQILREYRSEVIITLPRVNGFGIQLVADDRFALGDLAPEEQIAGAGVVSPQYGHITAAFEARYVRELDGLLEHRYVPTVYSSIPVGGGFELRNRTRLEMRDIAGTWSQRYIQRLQFGRQATLADRALFPYGQLDVHHDSRFAGVNRHDVTAGARFWVTPAASIDPFVTRSIDTHRSPRLGYAAGAALRVSL